MKLTIIGYGAVGKTLEVFLKHHSPVPYDPWLAGCEDKSLISGADVAVVCVPTPQVNPRLTKKKTLKDMRCDTSIVEDVVDWCDAGLIIVTSTVEPGTVDRLKAKTGKHIVAAPQFDQDEFFLFGGDPEDTRRAVELYLPCGGPLKKYIQTTAKTAELTKYLTDSFHLLKMAWVREIAALCDKTGLDYNAVRELLLLDPRINASHTAMIPSNDKYIKNNTWSLVSYAESIGCSAELLGKALGHEQ